MDKVNGYRTYITAGLLVVATGLHSLGWIDDKTYESIIAVLGAGGLAFLRSALPPK